MLTYVVYNPRYDFYEVYQSEPHWDEKYELWLGGDFLETVGSQFLPEEVAHKAKHCGRAIKCHAQVDVVYEVEEEEEES